MGAKTGMLFDTDKWPLVKSQHFIECDSRRINFLVIHLGFTNKIHNCNTAKALATHLQTSSLCTRQKIILS